MTTKKPPGGDGEPLPTVLDHVERKALERWQAVAIIARLNGEHVDGKRKYADGVTQSTRMSAEDFDASYDAMMTGRV